MHIDGNIESEQETELFLELEDPISIYPGELCRPLCMSTAIICLTIGTILCGKKRQNVELTLLSIMFWYNSVILSQNN